MKAISLYEKMEQDFITPEMVDVWSKFMGEVEDFLSDNFKERSMGVVCDFATEINRVYTAVFPTKEVMEYILSEEIEDAMLFVHHPSIWDIRKAPQTFYQMDRKILEKFKERRISIYNLHVPLDNFSEYSTSRTLAEAIGIDIEKPFAASGGALNGVIGRTHCCTMKELNKEVTLALGHGTKFYLYGEENITDGRVAVIAGGGNDKNFAQEMLENNVRILITGITALNERSRVVHEFEKENKINVIGGTHYSTERFACERMNDYFGKLGLASTFIKGEPILEDM